MDREVTIVSAFCGSQRVPPAAPERNVRLSVRVQNYRANDGDGVKICDAA